MKYTNTSRTLSLLIHGLLILAFGALGFYFAFFVVPQFWFRDSGAQHYWTENLIDGSYFLYLELATIGMTIFVLSIFGFYYAIKGLTHEKDDEPVRKSLTVFIAEGWFIAIVALLQGSLLFDLLANSSSYAFVIVMGLVIAVIALIATNIPMVKMYDGKNPRPLFFALCAMAFVATIFIAIEVGIGIIGNSFQIYADKHYVSQQLILLFVMNFVGAILFLLGAVFVRKEGKDKVVASFASSGFSVLGIGMILFGIFDIILDDSATLTYVHFNLITKWYSANTSQNFGFGFPVMSIVIGAVVLLGSLALIYTSFVPKASKEVTNKQ